MRIPTLNFRSNRVRNVSRTAKTRAKRMFQAEIDRLENRQLLAAGLFLQGTAFVDTSANANHTLTSSDPYLAGATINLLASNDQTVLATTTTDSNGYYLFNDSNVTGGLAAGTYYLQEIPPTGYSADGTQIQSQLNPATQTANDTIEVTLQDPSQVSVGINISQFFQLNQYNVLNLSVGGVSNEGSIGQIPATVTGGSTAMPSFYTFCVNALEDLSQGQNSFPAIQQPISQLSGASGEIGYLFNHYANQTLTADQAGGLQLAIWSLEYGSSLQLTGPVAPYTSQTDYNSMLSYESQYLADAAGKSESAIFLQATIPNPTNAYGYQDVLATGSYDFGNVQNAGISGNVYCDNTNSGVLSAGDEGLSAVPVTITGTTTYGAAVNVTTNTDVNGNFSQSLPPGTYTIAVSTPTGDFAGKATVGSDTSGTDGTVDATNLDQVDNVVLTQGDTASGYNFALLQPSTLAGSVTNNVANAGISGVTLTLTGTNDLGQTIDQTTTTDSNGNYSFSGLRMGTYVITETLPSNDLAGTNTPGTVNGTTDGTDSGANAIGSINLNFCSAGTDYSFANTPGVSISGVKYLDSLGEGFRDPSAYLTPLGGVTINLYSNSGLTNLVATTTTNATTGAYSFTGLAAGTYYVAESVPSGYVMTDGPANRVDYTVTATAGQSVTSENFADFQKCAPSSELTNVYYVINNSKTVTNLRGNVNPGDTVTAYFTVDAGVTDQFTLVSYNAPNAYFNANDAYQQTIYQQQTGTFTGGANGTTYHLTVTVPNADFQVDFVCGAAISLGAAGSNQFYTPQGRLISADNNGPSACNGTSSSVTGFVYVNEDNTGTFDQNNVGLPGVDVTLSGYDTSGNFVKETVVTASDGSYTFKNLPAGTYQLTEYIPNGYMASTDNVGTVNGSTDGTFSACDQAIEQIVLTGCNDGINYDLGVIGNCVSKGDTATIGFWQNKNGQAIINNLNGGSSATNLGNWLATTLPNLFGASATNTADNLAGMTNAQVASFYKNTLFKTDKNLSQIFTTAVSVYVTDSLLNNTTSGQNLATKYGFHVDLPGSGAATYDIGGNGGLFGVSNNSTTTLFQLLVAADAQAAQGSLSQSVYSVFDAINNKGDV